MQMSWIAPHFVFPWMIVISKNFEDSLKSKQRQNSQQDDSWIVKITNINCKRGKYEC